MLLMDKLSGYGWDNGQLLSMLCIHASYLQQEDGVAALNGII